MFDKPLMIFDCDGVLIDSEAIYLKEEFAVLSSKGVIVDRNAYKAEFMALAQPLWRTKFSALIEQYTGSPFSEEEYNTMKERVRRLILEDVTTINGIEDLLSALKVPVCVASTTQMKFLPGKLEKTGLAKYFGEGIYSGDMVENGKPAPDLFLYAARKMNVSSDNTIVVEDSVNGVRGGKAAGMFTIGFTGGSHCFDGHKDVLFDAGADMVVESFAELQKWAADNTNAIY